MDKDPTTRELMDALIDFKDGVADQFAGVARRAEVNERFDRVDAKLVEHDKRFEALEFHYGSLDRRVGRIETRLEDVERRLPA
jgi:predicted  nucleic acid-binding Zn-ribbon protein